MSYTILQVKAETYADIRQRLVDLDERIGLGPVYQREYVRRPRLGLEHIVFGDVGLEALPPETHS